VRLRIFLLWDRQLTLKPQTPLFSIVDKNEGRIDESDVVAVFERLKMGDIK